MSKLFLKLVALTSPIWAHTSATALPLQPAIEPTHAEPQLVAQVYYRGYRRQPMIYRSPEFNSTNRRNDCNRMGVAPWFCQEWLQEVAAYRQEWGFTRPQRLLNRLRALSPAARARLGNYSNRDINDQDWRLRRMGMDSHVIDIRTDRRFFQMFPERGEQPIATEERMSGQIWTAIREDVILRMEADSWREPQMRQVWEM